MVKRRVYQLEDVELVGADYLWKVVLHGASPVADRAIELLREVYTSLGPRLQGSQVGPPLPFLQRSRYTLGSGKKCVLAC